MADDQPRRTLKKHTLRTLHRQPQPPPRVHPAIESWHGQVPSTVAKLTPQELRQWKLDDAGPDRPGKGLYLTTIALRVLSFVLAFVIAVIGLKMLSIGGCNLYRQAPVIVPGTLISAWDTLEFVVVCARKSRKGMPRLVHLSADGLICLLVAACIAFFCVSLFTRGYTGGYGYMAPICWDSAYASSTGHWVLPMVFLAALLLIHTTFFFLLYSRQLRGNRHTPTPRTTYLPGTEEAGLSRPYRPEPTHQQGRQPPEWPGIELDPLPATDGGANLPSPVPLQPTPAAGPQPTESPTADPFPRAFLVLSPGQKGPSQPGLQTVPPRKPVPGSKGTGTHYATPWPPDHVPDEAELARARKGESQAQWMTLADAALDLVKTRVPEDSARESEKSDLFRVMGVRV